MTLTNVVVTGNRAGNGGRGGSGTSGASCPGGKGGGGGNGGGISNYNQSLTLNHVVITNNRAGDGVVGGEGGTSSTGCVGGAGGAGGEGGGLYTLGPVSMTDTAITGNSAGNGGQGGEGSSGASGLADGGLGGNGGAGGGFANESLATVSISSSTVAGNLAGPGGQGGMGASLLSGGDGHVGANGGTGGLGGGIYNTDSLGTTSVVNSTVTSNDAGDGGYGGQGGDGALAGHTGGQGGTGGTGGGGGGIYANAGPLAVTNVTLSSNGAGGAGGPGAAGIPYHGGGPGTIGSLGSAGTGGSVTVNPSFGATVTEKNTIVSAGTPENCIGTITDGGHNLSFPDISCPHTVTGDPKLSPLADHGGPTQTMGLLSGSAAIGQVPATGAGCPSTDQRGVVRPQPAGGACDIGAYEFAPPVCRSVAVATHGTHPVAVQLSCGDPARLAVQYAIVRRPAHGTLGGLSASAGKVTYTAKSGFSGRDQFTYAASNLNGSASAQTVTVNVARVPLTISGARLSKRRFHVGTEVTFQFTLSLASQVKITITHLHHGRTVTNGSISSHKRAGKATIGFDGTLHGGALVPGSYKATLVASVSGRKSAPVSLSFVIL